jgi:hypothetical protein
VRTGHIFIERASRGDRGGMRKSVFVPPERKGSSGFIILETEDKKTPVFQVRY